MRELYKVVENILRLLTSVRDRFFKLQSKFGSNRTWNCFLPIMSHHCDIPEGKRIFAGKHGLAGQQPCFRWLTTLPNIRKLRVSRSQRVIQTMVVRGQSDRMKLSDKTVGLATKGDKIVLDRAKDVNGLLG